MTERKNQSAEQKAIEGSKMFEDAWEKLNWPEKYSPEEVIIANHFLETERENLIKDLQRGTIDADFADMIFTGLYHHRGYEIIREDDRNSPFNGRN